MLHVNSASVPARLAVAAQKRLPHNVWLLPGKAAWNSHRVLMGLAQLLGRTLAPVASQYRPVLILDTARCHLAPCVVQASLRAHARRERVEAARAPPSSA